MNSLILFGRFDDSLQVFRPLGPGEWVAGLIVAVQEAMQEILEILLGALHAVRQALFAKNAEEALNQVHPGSMRGGVVKLDLLMAAKPSPRGFILVDVQIVHDHMQFPLGVGSHNVVHEPQKVDRGAPVPDMSDDLAGGNLQGCDHGLRSVPDIFIGPTPRGFGT